MNDVVSGSLSSRVEEARRRLDEHVREMVRWHFDPATGCPLWLSRAARAPALTFVALGLGFMLLEMAFLQRAMVRLGSPVFAAAAVLGGFLIGAGLGSRVGERLGRPLRRANCTRSGSICSWIR